MLQPQTIQGQVKYPQVPQRHSDTARYLQSPSPSPLLLVVDAPQGGDGGGQSARQQLGGLSVDLWLGPQQGDDVLQGAGGLQAQSVHHVAQVVCGAGRGIINPSDLTYMSLPKSQGFNAIFPVTINKNMIIYHSFV